MIGRAARLLVASLLFAASTAVAASSPPSTLVLEGATIYDGTGQTIKNGTVVVAGDRITYVGAHRPATLPPTAKFVSLHGKFLIPGLIDAHVHFGQTGFFEARPDYVDLGSRFPYPQVLAYQRRHPVRYYPAYLGHGITAVYDVGGAPWTLELPLAAEPDPNAPRIAAVGPMLTPAPDAAIARFNAPFEKIMVNLDDDAAATELVRYSLAWGAAGIKLWGIPQDDALTRMRVAVNQIKQAGSWALAHATTLVEAKAALKLGAAVLVHSVEDQPVDDEFLALARREQVIYIPTLSVHRAIHDAKQALLGKALAVEDPCGLLDATTRGVLDDAANLADAPTRARLAAESEDDERQLAALELRMADNLRRVHAAGVAIAVGTDAGNPGQLHGFSLITELEAMQRTGIDPHDLLTMATVNGALAMHRSVDLGTIAEGKLADLVVLSQNPATDISHVRAVNRVMKGGQWIGDVCAASSAGNVSL
jgi:imidazolonepropionase-like amidohydrolase